MTKSETLYQQACQFIPGGVNSPVRAFKGVGGTPIFFNKAQGAYLWDVDGQRYIDYVGSWGPAILGHSHPRVVEALIKQLPNGLSFGAPTELEILLAKKITEIMPSIEMVRMVSSGTEATLSAIRLARGFTKRNKILKFIGCYHGHVDSLLVKAGSGILTCGIADTAGIPAEFAQETLLAEFNDLDAVKEIFKNYGEQIAAIIVEPIAGNMNFVYPTAEFLPGLRKLCDDYGSVLIIDEVMTGFRVAKGGAQELFNIKADITTLGKVIGGGLPVGAFGGRRDIMECLAPVGSVYQAGTLSGNPLAMAAGLATLAVIEQQKDFYQQLGATTEKLVTGLMAVGKEVGVPILAKSIGGMFGFFFTEQTEIRSFEDVQRCDVEQFKKFFHAMLLQGVYLAPSAFEAGFVSAAHSEQDIVDTLATAKKVLMGR